MMPTSGISLPVRGRLPLVLVEVPEVPVVSVVVLVLVVSVLEPVVLGVSVVVVVVVVVLGVVLVVPVVSVVVVVLGLPAWSCGLPGLRRSLLAGCGSRCSEEPVGAEVVGLCAQAAPVSARTRTRVRKTKRFMMRSSL